MSAAPPATAAASVGHAPFASEDDLHHRGRLARTSPRPLRVEERRCAVRDARDRDRELRTRRLRTGGLQPTREDGDCRDDTAKVNHPPIFAHFVIPSL